MTVTTVRKDPEALTLTFTVELAAPVERVWQLWADPRQIEQWWGPPTWPATFVHHDVRVGGRTNYFMTGPDGEKAHGWWEVRASEPPRRLELEDGFADENGQPNASMPTTNMVMTLDEGAGGSTVMVVESRFPSLEVMEKYIEMGAEEGMRLALGQIDAILAS